MADLAGRVAVVTGGSKGIGLAIARAVAAAGASVVATSRSGGRDEPNIRQIRADVRRPADAARAIDEAASSFGGLDILVNNAGIGTFAHVADTSVELWRSVIETNLDGVFYCCHAAIPHLRRRGGGWI